MRSLSNVFETTDGHLIIDGVDIPIEFKIELTHICPRCAHNLVGYITYVKTTLELISLVERSQPLTSDMLDSVTFDIVGDVTDELINYAELACTNCYFTSCGDMPKISSEKVSCDLTFTTINPNVDLNIVWTSLRGTRE